MKDNTIIMFSGPDCSGKDSLMHGLAKLYNYKYFMAPRSPMCNAVYDDLCGRANTTLHEQVNAFLDLNTIFVLVVVEPKILYRRAVDRNEVHVKYFSDFEKHMKAFIRIFNITKLHSKKPENFISIENNSSDFVLTLDKLKSKVETCQTH